MAHTIYCGKVAKRKNSTLRPDLNTSFSVLLKSPTSLHTPTFSISAESFDYNYIQWQDRYYFVTDVVSRNNNLWDVSCVCDVLATYKSDILASTQFVSYSSYKSSIWLPDTRLPITKDATISVTSDSPIIFDPDTGVFILTAIGKNGCNSWCLDGGQVQQILDKLNSWCDDLLDAVTAQGQLTQGDYPFNPNKSLTYNWATNEDAIKSLASLNALSFVAGNAYTDAPNCIRSCLYLPFESAIFEGTQANLELGQFDTGIQAYVCNPFPRTNKDMPIILNIPWQFSDFRRATCEEIYLYLPLVGMVNIPSDEIIKETTLSIIYSVTPTDGVIAYEVSAGSQRIGTYSGKCAINFPLGISQQASLGEVAQTLIKGIEKTMSVGLQGASSLNPAAWGVGGAAAIFAGAETTYNVIDTAATAHNTCIGGTGGGVGAGLTLDIECFSIAHPTVIEPDAMRTTMGVPTMQPMTLSSLTGFCQCANAHVSASGAELSELAEIDSYLNSGFYIE